MLSNLQARFDPERRRVFDEAFAFQRPFVLIALIAIFIFSSFAVASAENRTLRMYYTHTKESITVTYKRNGKWDRRGLRKLNRFLRDFRRNEPTKMDPELFDVVWEIYKKSGSRKPIHVISGYRSPRTNRMLRRRGRKVARKSQHTRGKALDFFLPDVSVKKLRALGLKAHAGGVGYYRGSFVHIDTGRVRHWPRMSRRQLSRIFPKGRTIHVPSNGRPLKGYKVAAANLKRGRNYDGSKRGTGASSSLLARIFKKSGDDGDEGETATRLAKVKATPTKKPAVVAKKEVAPKPAPAPKKPEPAKPAGRDPFALELAVAKKAGDDERAARKLALAAQAKLEAEAAQPENVALSFPNQVAVPQRRPVPKVLIPEPNIRIAEANTDRLLKTNELVSKTRLALVAPERSASPTQIALRPSADVPDQPTVIDSNDADLKALKARIQTAYASQNSLSAAQLAARAQASLRPAGVIPDQPVVQVALAEPQKQRRVAIPKWVVRGPVQSDTNAAAVEAAKVPVPKAAERPVIAALPKTLKKEEFVASVASSSEQAPVEMIGELQLGNLDGATVKAWAIATSTRVGPVATLTAPAYQKSTMRAAPASVYSVGFADNPAPLRADRFSGRALTRVAFANFRVTN